MFSHRKSTIFLQYFPIHKHWELEYSKIGFLIQFYNKDTFLTLVLSFLVARGSCSGCKQWINHLIKLTTFKKITVPCLWLQSAYEPLSLYSWSNIVQWIILLSLSPQNFKHIEVTKKRHFNFHQKKKRDPPSHLLKIIYVKLKLNYVKLFYFHLLFKILQLPK